MTKFNFNLFYKLTYYTTTSILLLSKYEGIVIDYLDFYSIFKAWR